MESYWLKSGIILLCFYTIYWLLVRHNDHFNLNRMVILFSVFAAGVLPLLSFDLWSIENKQFAQKLQPIIISGFKDTEFIQNTSNSFSIFSIVYIIGLVVLSIRSLTGVATLVHLYRKFPKQHYHGFTAVIMDGNQTPFTFFNFLFINGADYRKGNVSELIIHEQAHRYYFHSIDLIVMEILTIINWFNPFIWLFKHDLKSEHEFCADEQVIKEGFDKTSYQHLLLQSNEGIALYLANHFNYSILKKRLKMMTSKKSNRAIKFNYVLALPLLLLSAAILFFNFQMNGQVSMKPNVLPVYKTGNSEMYKTIGAKIKYPKEARVNNAQGLVYVSFTVTKTGEITKVKAEKNKYNLLEEIVVVAYSVKSSDKKDMGEKSIDLSALEKEAERAIGLLGDFTPGEKKGKPASVRLTLPITFKLGEK